MSIASTDKERIKKKQFKAYMIMAIVGYIYVVLAVLQYSALKYTNKRLSSAELLNKALVNVFVKPFAIFPISSGTLTSIALLTMIAAALALFFYVDRTNRKADNPNTVNGEAHLMNLSEYKEYNLKFAAPIGKPEITGFNNMILSRDIRLAIDNKGTRRNCNVLVIGGSGAGKSRFFAAPNILQYNANFVITDPSGEMLRDYGKALENVGYDVKVFNLTDVYKGNRYNPFHYIKEEKDVFILVNTLIKNTNPEGNKGGDPFWEKSENLLLTALILYLWHMYDERDQTFTNVLKLINMAEVDENDPSSTSKLDLLFEDLKKKDPNNLAVRQYAKFKQGAGKTLKSILISVAVRLQTFDLQDIEYLTGADDLELEKFSDTKQALFVITPTADTTFSFLVSLLYSQLFSTLYEYAETRAIFGWKLNVNAYTTVFLKQASNSEESEAAKKIVTSLAEEIHNDGVVVGYFDKDNNFHLNKMDPLKKVYRIYSRRTKTFLGHRGTKEQVQQFLQELKNVKALPCEEKCPNHVRLILDEFANIGEIPDFDQKLATMRKYEISCSIILQALSQLKVMYKDRWNTIVANCDTKLFLGCDDTETIEWMLKMLGKRTTTVTNTSISSGKRGDGSISYNKSSIELLTIDQISMMQDSECLVRIRAVRPYYGKKYELTDHPNYKSAIALKGTFVIPVSDEAVSKKASAKALRLRTEEDKSSTVKTETPMEKTLTESLAEEELKEDSNKEEIDVIQEALNRKEEAEAKKRKVKNSARMKNAKENAKNSNAEPDFKPLDMASMLDSFGINQNSTDSQIKECIESLFVIEEFNTDDLIYTMTS